MINYLVKKILFKRKIGTSIAVLWLLLSFLIEYKNPSYPLAQNIFSSSGAIFTIVGLFLTIKASTIFHIEIEEKDKDEDEEKNEKNVLKKKLDKVGSGPAQCQGEFSKEEMINSLKPIETDEVWGFTLIVIGTLIWGYGSLLFLILSQIINCVISNI